MGPYFCYMVTMSLYDPYDETVVSNRLQQDETRVTVVPAIMYPTLL
jgi:hypothetical protein